MNVHQALLPLVLFLLGGCAGPANEVAPDQPAEGPPQEWQTLDSTFRAATPVNCFVGMPPDVDGLTHAEVPVDERSKGQLFWAYINVTGTAEVLFAHVQFVYADDPDPNAHTYGSPPGSRIEGRVPTTTSPVTAYFDLCGATDADVTVTYRVPLAPAEAA